jgi:hypothetical protein
VKVPVLALTVVMCAMGLPVAIAQVSSMPGKPTAAMGSEHQMTEMQANFKEMQARQEAMQSTPGR